MKIGDIVTINRDAVPKDHPALQHGGEGEVIDIKDDLVWVKPARSSPIYIMAMDELVVEGVPLVAPARVEFSPSTGTFVTVDEQDVVDNVAGNT